MGGIDGTGHYGTRTEERQNSRNGYRERELETRLGTVPLEIPRVRHGTYFPSFLEPRRRWEPAFNWASDDANNRDEWLDTYCP